jgi:hypothetical protein
MSELEETINNLEIQIIILSDTVDNYLSKQEKIPTNQLQEVIVIPIL